MLQQHRMPNKIGIKCGANLGKRYFRIWIFKKLSWYRYSNNFRAICSRKKKFNVQYKSVADPVPHLRIQSNGEFLLNFRKFCKIGAKGFFVVETLVLQVLIKVLHIFVELLCVCLSF